MRRAVVGGLCLLLSACGASEARAPFADSRAPPGLSARFQPPEGWAWGFLQTAGAPPQRYGVASPPVVPRASVLILPGAGESAESWFETAHDLLQDGATVWILERTAQGGSGRYTAPRDLMHAPSVEPDVAAVRAMLRTVIRPEPGAPLIVLADADAAVIALRAVQTGAPASGLILSAPRIGDAATRADSLKVRLGLGRSRPPGCHAWRRSDPDARARGLTTDRWRGGVEHAWETANPDLRMSCTSLAWRQAMAGAGRLALRDAARVRLPVLVMTPERGSWPDPALCSRLRQCRDETVPASRAALQMQPDPIRDRWIRRIARFVEDQELHGAGGA